MSASLDEDPYGQVQRDIPKTLEVLLSFLTSLDAFVAELEGSAKGEQEVAETRAVLAAEVDDLVTGTLSYYSLCDFSALGLMYVAAHSQSDGYQANRRDLQGPSRRVQAVELSHGSVETFR